MVTLTNLTPIGTCSVDSGTIALVDPCYVMRDGRFDTGITQAGVTIKQDGLGATLTIPKGTTLTEDVKIALGANYDDFLEEMLARESVMRSANSRIPDVYTACLKNLGVITGTTHGDGAYEVYAVLDNYQRVRLVVIDYDNVLGFDQNDDEEDM